MHHFLRRFDTMIVEFEPRASDADLTVEFETAANGGRRSLRFEDGRTLDVAELVLYLVDHSGEF